MSELEEKIEVPVKPFKVTTRKKCMANDCPGYMVVIDTGLCLTVNPPQYDHSCSVCNTRTTFAKQYPYSEIIYKEVK